MSYFQVLFLIIAICVTIRNWILHFLVSKGIKKLSNSLSILLEGEKQGWKLNLLLFLGFNISVL